MEYKYYVHDDDYKIKDAEFDNFADAYDYAQGGLITFITEVPVIDGVEDEEEAEPVWSWDETHDIEEAIRRVCNRHDNCDTDDYLGEDVSIEVEADEAKELADFARLILGDDYEAFDQDFEDEDFPKTKVDNDPINFKEEQIHESNDSANDYVIRNYNSGKYIDDAMNVIHNRTEKAKHFKTPEEAEEFMNGDGKYKNWKDHFELVKLKEEVNNGFDDFDIGPQSDEYAYNYHDLDDVEEYGDYVICNYNNGKYVGPDKNVIYGRPEKAAHFNTPEEADAFMNDDGKWPNWRDQFELVKLTECGDSKLITEDDDITDEEFFEAFGEAVKENRETALEDDYERQVEEYDRQIKEYLKEHPYTCDENTDVWDIAEEICANVFDQNFNECDELIAQVCFEAASDICN